MCTFIFALKICWPVKQTTDGAAILISYDTKSCHLLNFQDIEQLWWFFLPGTNEPHFLWLCVWVKGEMQSELVS